MQRNSISILKKKYWKIGGDPIIREIIANAIDEEILTFDVL